MLLFLAGLFFVTGMQPYQKESIEYDSEVYDSPELIPEPEEVIVDSDGVQYERSESTIEIIGVTGQKEVVSSEIIYEGIGVGEVIPELAEIKVWDEETNKTFLADLPLSETRFFYERWKDDFAFDVTLHTYGADIYILGEQEIKKGEEGGVPELGGREADLLAMIGLSDENYRIENYEWSGEPYTDEEGVMCRDIKAVGIRRIYDCAAVYEGTVSRPDYNQYRLKTNYLRKPELVKEPEAESVSATPSNALSMPPGEPEEIKSFWDKMIAIGKICLQVSVGLFCILLAYLGFRFLLFLARKVEKKRQERRR